MDDQRSDVNPSDENTSEMNPQQPGAQVPPAPQGGEYRAPHDLHVPPRPPAPQGGWAAPHGSIPQPPQFAAPGQQPGHGHPQGGGQAFGQAAHAQTQATEPLPPQFRMAAAGAAEQTDKPRRKSGAGRVAGILVAAALIGGAAGVGGGALQDELAGGGVSASSQTGPSNITVNNPGSVNEATAVATEVLPSVVTIDVQDQSQAGSGSGVILSEDGYVVTNTHVVTLGGATASPSIRVTTSDGRIYQAEVVGTDPTYDLAVIKLVDAENLTPVEFADSSKLNVGDTTVALGAPLGLPNTVTTGIVSALNRSIEIASAAAPDSGDETQPAPEEEEPESPFRFDNGQPEETVPNQSISISVIQTDAAINHGNSGGALVDSQGRLIGINVAIASSGGSEESGSIGVGFAIPSNIVQRISDELIADGEATHGLLGATVQPASVDENATTSGALIAQVTPGGAAAEAGLRKGDIVTEFNGVRIGTATDLTAQVRAVAAGSDATLTYVRGGESHTVDVTLGELTQ
ncbi:PDZ domain-containing protein [Microbacterium paludicola]|uniref:PDZ domain-containing protein n=1 Tax=Microbacterium paludicola TaxID=300019 RepID=A0A4Y9FWV6_9MICO|nr:trypsin-like peptidase domain-containing protein [Microbacterium paludicola]MBF0815563.1 trypsin-like peptidase domain-containing protein [Microbacterium paludicola]TFU33824.1 PDZ domain-containing protein [Microbacterium paludicola]